MRRKKFLYFAHPLLTHNTLLERVIMRALHDGSYDVVNPAEDAFQRSARDECERSPEADPLAYWFRLARTCHACAFTTLPPHIRNRDGTKGGVRRVPCDLAKVVNDFLIRGCPIWWVPPIYSDPTDVSFVTFKNWRGFSRLSSDESEYFTRMEAHHGRH